MQVLFRERGLDFELGYLRFLHEQGKTIVEPDPRADELAVDRTLAAMQAGVDVIYQASLRSDPWQGRADFLVKADEPSELGNWSYEVVDVGANAEGIPTYPTPCANCEICRWWRECDRRRRNDDHLSLVAYKEQNLWDEIPNRQRTFQG